MSIPSIQRIPMSFARADWETIRAALLVSIRNHERNQARPSAAHEQHLRVIIANELRHHADDHRPKSGADMPQAIDQIFRGPSAKFVSDWKADPWEVLTQVNDALAEFGLRVKEYDTDDDSAVWQIVPRPIRQE